jgi:dephospho-CoA kinase
LILGLTGGYCTGKNLAAGLLASWGWHCIDVDKLGHQALERSLPVVMDLLGPQSAGADGKPDRRFIGKRVFADADLLKRYEAIVHPVMFALVDDAIAVLQSENPPDSDPPICINAAILFAMPQAERCFRILELRAPLHLRLIRAMARDHIGPLRVLQRIQRQRALFNAGTRLSARIRTVVNSAGRDSLAAALTKALAEPG